MFKKSIDGKKVIVKANSKNIPPIKVIKDIYAKIPDNKRIPIVFETREQYLDEYIKNQEKAKKIRFTEAQKQQYKHTELQNMKNIVSRYTTNHNPYIDRRVVFFNDHKIPLKQFKDSALHEYGHELWEKNPKLRRDWKSVSRTTSPTSYGATSKQEDFAESFMLAKTGRLQDPKREHILSDAVAQNRANIPAWHGNIEQQTITNQNFRKIAFTGPSGAAAGTWHHPAGIQKDKPSKNDLSRIFPYGATSEFKYKVFGEQKYYDPMFETRDIGTKVNIIAKDKIGSVERADTEALSEFKIPGFGGIINETPTTDRTSWNMAKLYSVRPFKEKYLKKVHPADVNYNNNMFGRGTGYFGTGIYGYDTKEVADADAKHNEGYVREFEIVKPFKPKTKYESQELHDESKALVNALAQKDAMRRNAISDATAGRLANIGITITPEEMRRALIQAKNSGEQPINKVLRMKGYDGVIPSTEFQNRSYGSVMFHDPAEDIPLDKTPFSAEELERKKAWMQRKHTQGTLKLQKKMVEPLEAANNLLFEEPSKWNPTGEKKYLPIGKKSGYMTAPISKEIALEDAKRYNGEAPSWSIETQYNQGFALKNFEELPVPDNYSNNKIYKIPIGMAKTYRMNAMSQIGLDGKESATLIPHRSLGTMNSIKNAIISGTEYPIEVDNRLP